MMVDV